MNKRNFLIATCIVLVVIIVATTLIILNGKNEEIIASRDTVTQQISNINNDTEISDVILTISSTYDINKLTLDNIMNNDNCFVVLGKIKSIDGTTNYNPKTQEYTDIFSYGKLEIIDTLKGNLDNNVVDIMKIGGKITLSDYEKSLSSAQKQKEEVQSLLNTYAKSKSTVYVENKNSEILEPEIDKEYLFVMYYNDDYNKYILDTFPDALKEVKRENSKLSLKDNSTNQFKEFTTINTLFE